MAKYIIAIGGTGARFLESLLHFCATGLGPNGKISAIIIDPDKANGNVVKLKKCVEKYKECREIFKDIDEIPIFRTEIDLAVWSPVGNENKLDDYFAFDNLSPELQDLFNLFYTEAERKEKWDVGFKGRANLGAPVMADVENHLNEVPWKIFIDDMTATLDSGICHLFIAGSIFGATGASGVPTIAKLLRAKKWDKSQNLKIGGLFVLPYFYFDTKDKNELGLYADSKDFLTKIESALLHYKLLWGEDSPYDRIYFLGSRTQEKFENFSVGGQGQKNPASWIELVGATSFLHFISDSDSGKYAYARRDKKRLITWEDIPISNLKRSFTVFSMVIISYKKFFRPLIDEDISNKKKRVLIPWYLKSFDKLRTEEENKNLDKLNNYMNYFLKFIKEIQEDRGSDSGLRVRLFEPTALELEHANIGKLLVKKKEIVNSYDKLFDILCNNKWKESGHATTDIFNMLYQASDNFCKSYYKLK